MKPDKLLQLIEQRHSSRGPFDDAQIDTDALHRILEAATWAPTAHNMQNFEIVVVHDPALLAKLSELSAPTSPVFVAENYKQLSFSEDELKAKKTGLLATQFPPAWMTPEAQAGHLDQPASPLGDQVRRGPVLLVITYDPSRRAPASENDFLGAISLGCMIENMWLMATALGIDFHIISSLANEPIVDGVKQILGIPKELAVALSIRLGHAADEHQGLRVRRELADFVSLDTYGVHPPECNHPSGC